MPPPKPSDPSQQAQFLLYYDDLTGLYNRRFYNNAYDEQTKQAAADQTPMGMILIDVDFFKSINDRYGHQSGDAILSGVGGVINETVGMSGYPIRYAGDEFVVLLPGQAREECTRVAQALAENVRARTFRLPNNDRTVKMTFSVGVAHYPTDTEDPALLFEHSDHAAYIAKKNGRDRFVNYEPGVKQVLNASTLYQFFPCAKLIGREKLMEELVEHLVAPAGQPRPWYMVAGPPGMGKTRLLLELRNRVDTQRSVLLETVGLPARPQQPFGFFIDALGRYVRETPAAAQQMAAVLTAGELTSVAHLLPDMSRYALLASSDNVGAEAAEVDPVEPLCRMLGVLSQTRSLTILLDDLQRADRDSLRLLERLRSTLAHIYICTAVRDDAATLEKNGVLARFLEDVVDRSLATLLPLPPLTAPQVQELIETILADAKAFPTLGALVHERSGGVVLHVEEILKLLVQRGAIRYEGATLVVDVSADQIPADVNALLLARAAHVDLDVRVLMSRAAVIGPEFDLSTLKLLEGRDEGYLGGILERARKSHIISETWTESDNRIRFVSSQTHASFYASIDEDLRRKLHLRLGRLRERQHATALDEVLTELAYHYQRAGDGERAQRYRKILDELYSQFVGPRAIDTGVDSAALKQMVGQMELPEPLMKRAVEIVNELKIYLQKQRVYGSEVLVKQGAYEKLARQFAELFLQVGSVMYSEGDRKLLVNGVAPPQNLQFATGFVDTLLSYDVRALEFKVGVSAHDIKVCLDLLGLPKDELRSRGGLGPLLRENGIETITANEKIFVAVGERDIVLKRTRMRDELIIKDIDDPADAAPAATATPDIAPDELEAFREWQRTFRRYGAMEVLEGAKRDWPVLQRDLESDVPAKVSAATKVYADAGAEAADALVTVIAESASTSARRIAMALLADVTPDTLRLLIERLYQAKSAAEACRIFSALETLGDAQVVPYAEAWLQHPNATVRGSALSLAAAFGESELGGMLLRALASPEPDIRLDMVTAMGEYQLHETADTLLQLIEAASIFGPNEPPELQAAACIALGRLGTPRLLTPLLEVLDTTHAICARPGAVRAAAASALPAFDTPQAHDRIVGALRACLHDADPEVVEAVAASLEALGLESPVAAPGILLPSPAGGGGALLEGPFPAPGS